MRRLTGAGERFTREAMSVIVRRASSRSSSMISSSSSSSFTLPGIAGSRICEFSCAVRKKTRAVEHLRSNPAPENPKTANRLFSSAAGTLLVLSATDGARQGGHGRGMHRLLAQRAAGAVSRRRARSASCDRDQRHDTRTRARRRALRALSQRRRGDHRGSATGRGDDAQERLRGSPLRRRQVGHRGAARAMSTAAR